MIMAVSAMPMQSVRVVKSATCGRKLVATSRFAPGQCILEELPYAYTLKKDKRGSFCEFCLKQCSTLTKCSSCKYVSYCSTTCEQGDWTRCHKNECKTLKGIRDWDDPYLARCLSQIVREQRRSPPCTQDDENGFPTTVDQLESHHEKLSNAKKDMLKTLVLPGGNYDKFLDEDIFLGAEPINLKICGATLYNSIFICDNDLKQIAYAIYLRANVLNHSCDPNCVLVYDGRKLQIRTVKDVKEGEECTISFINIVNPPTKKRQALLGQNHYFTCKCVKCIKEIVNALEPDDGLAEEVRGLEKLTAQIQYAEYAEESPDLTKVLQLCEPYLKLMDSSSCLPADHYLLVAVRAKAFDICIIRQSWEKAAEIGQLLTEPYRDHYGPYHPTLGIHLLRMGKILHRLERLQEARKYVTEAKSVLEVTHGPKHSLMSEVQELFLLL